MKYIILISRADPNSDAILSTAYGIFKTRKRAEAEAHKLFHNWCTLAGVDYKTHVFLSGPWVDVVEVHDYAHLNNELTLES